MEFQLSSGKKINLTPDEEFDLYSQLKMILDPYKDYKFEYVDDNYESAIQDPFIITLQLNERQKTK